MFDPIIDKLQKNYFRLIIFVIRLFFTLSFCIAWQRGKFVGHTYQGILKHSWNIEVKILGCYLRDVAVELFALKKALLKNEIDVFRFARRARKLRKRTRYYLKEILQYVLPYRIS